MIGPDPLVAHKQRAVQRRTRPRLGGTAWDPAPATIGGLPGGPGARHGPGGEERDAACTAAEPCDAMAAASRLRQGQLPLSGSLGKLCDITVLRSLRRRQMRMRGVPSETMEQGWYRPW
jgi:hypothetical protein